MFIGHFAPALIAATHKDAPRLPVLFVGAQLVDWAFFAFLLTGTEKMRFQQGISAMNPMDLYHMPYTHSLLGAAIWALGFAALCLDGDEKPYGRAGGGDGRLVTLVP